MEAKKPVPKKPAVTTIQQYFGLRAPALGNEAKYELNKAMSTRLVGIEVEVENHELQRHPSNVWIVKDDGSLRNNGAEWVTRPIPAQLATAALQDLLVNSLDESCCFSPRTSVHVHVNSMDLDVRKIPYLVAVYVIFEKLLYRFAGRGRQKNIFCVPVQETEELDNIGTSATNLLVGHWSKYTGFNIRPLAELGTVEARHMHGTRDVEKLTVWIDLLTRMVDYVHNRSFEDLMKCVRNTLDGLVAIELLGPDIFGPNFIHLGHTDIRDTLSGIDAARRIFLTPIPNHETLRKALTKDSPFFTNRIVKGL